MPGPLSVTSMIDEGRGFDAALYRLLVWFPPMFPVGAFSYSHGLEAAAERGKVYDCDSLQHWIAAVLAYGTGRIDADILRDAHRAAPLPSISPRWLTRPSTRGSSAHE